jgi:uncharacterized OsmC-like protein
MTEYPTATLSIKGGSKKGLKNTVQVRDVPSIIIDEPERLGGTNEGANPLEYFLASLSACTSIMIAYAAKEMGFQYRNVTYAAEGTLDPRGFKGVEGVQTYFKTISLDIEVETEETEASFQQLKETVEKRCPLYNLVKDAGVEIETHWGKKESAPQ